MEFADLNMDMIAGHLEQFIWGYAIVVVVVSVCYYWGMWKIFRKMYIPGWKCLVPIYSTYLLFKMTWNTGVYWLAMSLSVMINFLADSDVPHKLVIALCGAGILLLIQLVACHKLSKAFGHGIGYTLGLIFLHPLFILILGLGKSEFQETKNFKKF